MSIFIDKILNTLTYYYKLSLLLKLLGGIEIKILEKLLVIYLLGIFFILMNLTAISTKELQRFDLVALTVPEPLVEHPERANETHPEGTIFYIDTTNPYKDWIDGDPINELFVQESYNGYAAYRSLDIVLALDEEAVDKWGIDYAIRAVERADEAFVALHQIDFRIRATVVWESDDSIEWFRPDLYNDALEKLSSWLGSYINGAEIDAVIAISGQETKDWEYAGLAPMFPVMRHNTLTLIRFQIYWADDNLIGHEVSHLYGVRGDHPGNVEVDCIMTYYADYICVLVEDGGIYDMFCNVPRGFRIYTWCSECDYFMVDREGGPEGWRWQFIGGGVFPR